MDRTRHPGNLGLAAAAIGFAIAAIGLGAYQAWWTIAFAVGGLAISWADARGAAAIPAIASGLSIAATLAIGMLGVILVAMGTFGRARPDSPPGGGVPLLLLGLGVLVAAIVALGVTMRYLRRATEDTVTRRGRTGQRPSRDIRER